MQFEKVILVGARISSSFLGKSYVTKLYYQEQQALIIIITASQIKIHFQPHPTPHHLPGAPPAPHQCLSTRKYAHSSDFSHHRLALPFLSFHIHGILRWVHFHIWFYSLQIKTFHQHTDNACGRRGWVRLSVSSSCNKRYDCFYCGSLTGGRGKRGGLEPGVWNSGS